MKRSVLFGPAQSHAFAAGPAAERDGVPVLPFVKDAVHTGSYVHPKDGWKLDVTPERLNKWVQAFGQMKANGTDIEIVVDHQRGAEAVRGYVKDLFLEGGTLNFAGEARGEKGVELAKTCKNVSVYVEPFTDAKGNKYDECITHISWVQKPVITGQDFAKAIAASLAGRAEPLVLSTGSSAMDLDKLMKEIGSVLGVSDELQPEKAMDLLKQRIKKGDTDKTTAETLATDLQKKLEQANAQVGELNKKLTGDKSPPPADTLDMLAEGSKAKLDGLVEKGKLAPAVAASLEKILIGAPAARNAYALSATFSGRPTALAREILDALAENEVTDLKTRTGAQGKPIAMSHGRADDDGKPLAKEDMDFMVTAAYGASK